jgi:predicted outer membrane lipoprotein
VRVSSGRAVDGAVPAGLPAWLLTWLLARLLAVVFAIVVAVLLGDARAFALPAPTCGRQLQMRAKRS